LWCRGFPDRRARGAAGDPRRQRLGRVAKPAVSEVAAPTAAPVTTAEPPSVSIDELPIEGSQKKK